MCDLRVRNSFLLYKAPLRIGHKNKCMSFIIIPVKFKKLWRKWLSSVSVNSSSILLEVQINPLFWQRFELNTSQIQSRTCYIILIMCVTLNTLIINSQHSTISSWCAYCYHWWYFTWQLLFCKQVSVVNVSSCMFIINHLHQWFINSLIKFWPYYFPYQNHFHFQYKEHSSCIATVSVQFAYFAWVQTSWKITKVDLILCNFFVAH
jgi:hypothetical protein